MKGKEEKERYTHLNAEFQRIARRDKKAFLSDQCKEIEENNRMGKTRDLFKRTGDIKRTFHAMMGMIKDKIVRRDKKAFLSEQYKEIKENNRMGKTRDHFKKIGDTKGTFHAR